MMRRWIGLLVLAACGQVKSSELADAPPPDQGTVADDRVRSPEPGGVIVASATIDADGNIVSQDGWLATVTTGADTTTTRPYQLTFPNVFADSPNCACTSTGGGTHACRIPSVSSGAAEIDVSSPQNEQRTGVDVICVGRPLAPASDPVSGPGTSTLVLASARFAVDGTLSDGGDWLTGIDTTAANVGLWRLVLRPSRFGAPPRCACTWTGIGLDICKVEQPATASELQISTPNQSGGIVATASDVMCLGTAPTQQGRAVRSLLPTGMVIASATINADHTIAHQDGHWIGGVTDSSGALDVRFVAGTFTKPPQCTCSSLTSALASCVSPAAATANHAVVGSFASDGTAIGSDVAIVCVGE
jgi:hypothetical protein